MLFYSKYLFVFLASLLSHENANFLITLHKHRAKAALRFPVKSNQFFWVLQLHWNSALLIYNFENFKQRCYV